MSKDGKITNWSNDETKLLIQLWSEQSVQNKLDGTVMNSRVFSELAVKLTEAGHHRTPGLTKRST